MVYIIGYSVNPSNKHMLLQTVQLVKDLLAELPGGAGAGFTVVCADVDMATIASERLQNPVSVIDPDDSGVVRGPLIIVNPRADQVGKQV